MSGLGMVRIASSSGVSIYCPADGKFSFFNSPYPAHRAFAGVDIYPNRGFGEDAPSPVSGEVLAVRRVSCPRGRGFKGSESDYVILIRSLENPDRVVKILHVNPVVESGDVIKHGQTIGVLIRSGYFDFWTDPHIHVEVRYPHDPIRARGGLMIDRVMEVPRDVEPIEEIRGVVVKACPEYIMISLNVDSEFGLSADVDGSASFLDAGIPHYGWLGVHLDGTLRVGGVVRLCGFPIGVIEATHHGMGLSKCGKFRILLEGVEVGLSLHLYPRLKPLLKVVPYRLGAIKCELGEEVSLVIS